MLQAGIYHTLTVARVSPHGLYLTDGGDNEVLLPNRYASLEDKVGDEKRVFVYHDSENRLIATTETPLVKAGEAAFLEVVDKNVHGAFLKWGITAKDLFLPNVNQLYALEAGHKYVVFAYVDNISKRLTATTKLNGFLSNESLAVAPRQEVEILVAQRLPMGYRVIIENRHWGMIYENQIFRPISVGEKLRGYVRKITDDNRIDISLQQEGFDEVKSSADRLMAIIEAHGGSLALNDKSAPEQVAAVTQMSKKVFKRALGYLMSHRAIHFEDDVIKLGPGAR